MTDGEYWKTISHWMANYIATTAEQQFVKTRLSVQEKRKLHQMVQAAAKALGEDEILPLGAKVDPALLERLNRIPHPSL